MLIDTPEKMAKRQHEFDTEAIVRLTKLAHIKGKGSVPFNILENRYGMDLDFNNSDWGTGQKGS